MDVYFFALHEPYDDPRHPVPINAFVVNARTLLHRAVPQPDGARIFRCLTEFPGRTPGCLIPLSTLTYELDGGAGWPSVGDWEAVVEAVLRLSRARRCDAMQLGLGHAAAALLAQGPNVHLTVYSPDAAPYVLGPAQRQHHLQELTDHVAAYAAASPLWPGTDLVDPPRTPALMPYRPYTSRAR